MFVAQVRKYSSNQEEIILAAESLFGERGIPLVSLRQIISATSHRNKNAITYHFGSKKDLISAITEYRVSKMEYYRDYLRNSLKNELDSFNIIAILKFIFIPHLEMKDENGRHPYARFMLSRLLHYGMDIFPGSELVSDQSAVTVGEFLILLKKALPHLSPEIIKRRLYQCTLTFVATLVMYDYSVKDPSFEMGDLKNVISELFLQMQFNLSMPYAEVGS